MPYEFPVSRLFISLRAAHMATKSAVADLGGAQHSISHANPAVRGGFSCDEFDWKQFFKYHTKKHLLVNVWQLGAVCRFFQVLFLAYIAYSILDAHEWAVSRDIAQGMVNAWISGGTSGSVSASSAVYCNNNASYDYDYGGGWTYLNPVCRAHPTSSISQKARNQVFVTTMYQEQVREGWACADPNSAANVAACNAGGGVDSADGAQCSCVTDLTIYPLGVEAMTVSFRHSCTRAPCRLPAPEKKIIFPLCRAFAVRTCVWQTNRRAWIRRSRVTRCASRHPTASTRSTPTLMTMSSHRAALRLRSTLLSC